MSTRIYYWDASPFCALLNQEAGRVDDVTAILDDAEAGDVIIVTSFMTLTEVLKEDGQKPATVADQKRITEFFKKDYFEWVNFDRGIAEAARSLIWKHDGLKSKDAVHIASALAVTKLGVNLDVVHAYDDVFLKLSGKIDGLKCPMEHPAPSQLQMPLGDARRRRKKKKTK